jgi:hypothetical protein
VPVFNPQAVKNAVDQVIQPIKDAVEAVKEFVNDLKDFFDNISLRRRLGEETHAEVLHARGLEKQAHHQLEQVRGRLLHADTDHVRDGIKERLQLDVNRRLETHFAERKLTARRLAARELITISSLKVNIPLNLNSRLLIEAQKDASPRFELPTKSIGKELSIPLTGSPFVIKLATSFRVECVLNFQIEGDFKALLHLVVSRMNVEFDLSTNARERAVFSKGDWTHTIT